MQKINTLLMRNEVIELLSQQTYIDANKTVRITYIDFTGNWLSTEPYAYKVSFTDIFGSRINGTFYPFTIGLQSKSKFQGKKLPK